MTEVSFAEQMPLHQERHSPSQTERCRASQTRPHPARTKHPCCGRSLFLSTRARVTR